MDKLRQPVDRAGQEAAFGAENREHPLGANGGGRTAHDVVGRCDVLCTTSHLFKQQLVSEIDTVNALSGLEVKSIWVDEKAGQMDSVIADCVNWTDKFHAVDNALRDNIVRSASGLTGWISTGVWAVCLALHSGASSVHVCGVELAARADQLHVDADSKVLHAMGYFLGVKDSKL